MSKGRRYVLFTKSTCPYCQRAEKVLQEKKISYQRVEVSADRSFVKLLSGQETVPVLVDVIGCDAQDDDIIEYLKEF